MKERCGMQDVGTEVMGFTATDVLAVVREDEEFMSEAEAEKFLSVMGRKFQDRLTEEGFEILRSMVVMYRDEVANG
jgi:hypothetical protein